MIEQSVGWVSSHETRIAMAVGSLLLLQVIDYPERAVLRHDSQVPVIR